MSGLAEDALVRAEALEVQSGKTLNEIEVLQENVRRNLDGTGRQIKRAMLLLAASAVLLLWYVYRHVTFECDREHVEPVAQEVRDE